MDSDTENVNFEFVPAPPPPPGGHYDSHRNYRYKVNKKYKNRAQLCCVHKCGAKLIMDHQLKKLKFPGIFSGHEDDMRKAEMSLLTSLLKKNFQADPTETMKFTSQKTPDVPVPSYSRNKSTLYRVRAKELPLCQRVRGSKVNPPMEKHQSAKRFFLKKSKKILAFLFSRRTKCWKLYQLTKLLCGMELSNAPQNLFNSYLLSLALKRAVNFF